MAGNIDLQKLGSLATVTINNPARFNAMSRSMWRDLRDIFQRIQADDSLFAVVVSGQGHFCAGGDISEYASFRFQEDSLRDFHENDVWGGLQAMLDCDVPIVARIDGNCMGAGVEIASCCDIRIASDRARFGAPIAKLGFPMAPREAALVMRAVGELTAREMLLTAAVLDAGEMKQRGFLNQVVDVDWLDSAIHAFTERMRSLAPRASRLNKEAFRALAPVDIAHSAIKVIASAYNYADSPEHREGVTAFTEKRPPRFAQ
jgi:enoyl-CoA hydratase/carnithine racemase